MMDFFHCTGYVILLAVQIGLYESTADLTRVKGHPVSTYSFIIALSCKKETIKLFLTIYNMNFLHLLFPGKTTSYIQVY